MSFELLAVLRCPACDCESLDAEDGGLRCRGCGQEFPRLAGMPWLLDQPRLTIGQWALRCQSYLAQIVTEETYLKEAQKQQGLLASTKKRLAHTLQAKVEHRKALEKLLAPVMHYPSVESVAFDAFAVRLPGQVQLMGYYANVFRDWSWQGDENQAGVDALAKVAPDLGKGLRWLVLGAGAGRLVYDCHRRWEPEATVATDINPYLFLVFERLLKGNSLTLYDFPPAPLDLASFAIKNRMKMHDKAPGNLHLMFSDAMNPAFQDEAFDVVLTPWFIDIIPQDTRVFARRINRLLKPGGRWLNFGSLVYQHARPELCYSSDELDEIVDESGFDLARSERIEIPYLVSESSAQARRERVLVFCAEKTRGVAAPGRYQFWPDWLRDLNVAVPRLPAIDRTYSINKIYNEIMQHIDGRRSLVEIGALTAATLGVTADQGAMVLQQLLANLYEAQLRK